MVSALSLGADHLTLAVINSPITLSFGMIGLAAGQTLRLNAINIVRTPASVAIAQVPCRGRAGTVRCTGQYSQAECSRYLGYGKSAFVEAVSDQAGQVEVTGLVRIGSTQSFFCSVVPTLEVYDTATGQTHAILSNTTQPPSLIRPLIE